MSKYCFRVFKKGILVVGQVALALFRLLYILLFVEYPDIDSRQFMIIFVFIAQFFLYYKEWNEKETENYIEMILIITWCGGILYDNILYFFCGFYVIIIAHPVSDELRRLNSNYCAITDRVGATDSE